MSEHNSVGMVQTVNGLVPPDRLGPTLTHEHLLIDLAWFRTEPAEASGKAFIRRPMSQEMLGYVRHHNMANWDNGQLFDVETAIDEVNLYKQYGGGSIVDATSIGIARDPVGLARIARATGVNVIMGASHYVAPAHPADMDDRSEDSIFGKIVEDVTEGVDGTGIRSGIIGEVGCSWPLTDNERKVLRASGRAQLATGAPLLIHPGRDETAPLEIIEVLSEVGADLSRTIIGHLDRTVFLHETLKSIAESGCYMEWDLFGSEQSLLFRQHRNRHARRRAQDGRHRVGPVAGLRRQGGRRPRHLRQAAPGALRRPRLLLHSAQHSAQDARPRLHRRGH